MEQKDDQMGINREQDGGDKHSAKMVDSHSSTYHLSLSFDGWHRHGS